VTVTDLFYALAWPPVFAFGWTAIISRALRLGPLPALSVGESWVCGGLSVVYAFAFGGPWSCAVIGAAHVAIGVWLWRRGRRGRRRAPRAYGAKSRALVAALVAKARDAAAPRPVFRPVPGAAR
jgi:hypothetical protein